MQTDANLGRIQALHLEDNEYDRLLVAGMLRESGLSCEIKAVQSEAELSAALQEAPYDLVISDYSLPSYNGLKALALAKAAHPDIPFIFFSGTIGEEKAIESLKSGAVDYVLKQSPSRLVPAIRQALQHAKKQALLREAEQKNREQVELLDKARDAILVCDLDNRLTFWNQGAERIYGWSKSEAIGRDADQLLLKEPTPQLEEVRQSLAERGEWTGEMENVTRDGRAVIVQTRCTLILDDLGRPKSRLILNTDITDRKRTESRFLRLVDSNVQGVFFWNANGAINGGNDAFLHLVGYTREDLEAGRINWMALTPPEYAYLDRHALDEITAKGVCDTYEKEWIRQDGSRVPILIGAASFEDNPDEGVCFVVDLTERKKLEQQFLRSQRMESIGTLAGGIAHDLNNILAPIMMSIEILKLTTTDPQARNLLETIETTSKRGADIVRQVLSFARGLEGERIEVQSKHLLKDLKGIIKDTFPKNIRLEFSLPNDTWTILGDPTQIHQILLNLCVNARDAMPNGGRLTISIENCVLDEHYAAMNIQAKPGHYIQITVTDSGTGISPDVIDKIFEPFFTTKDVGKGTGLGLSTVMAIVKSHNGFVNVYSEPGTGTTFKIYLPALEFSSEEQKKEMHLIYLPRGNGETILVIDDEASILTITGQTLQAFGYRVLTATDGAEAVAVYARHLHEIAVVITDMMMPVMDGPATIHALLRINPAVKIVAASGLNANGGVAKVTGSGVKHFLMKPYTAETLLKTMRTVLEETG